MNVLTNISQMVRALLPAMLRKANTLDFLKAAVKPLQDVNDNLVSLDNDMNYRLRFSNKKVYLEHYLNDQYDPILRRIYIERQAYHNKVYLRNVSEGKSVTYIRNESEGKPVVYIRNESEGATVHFIVHIPSDVTYDADEFKAKVNQYKTLGYTYSLQTF